METNQQHLAELVSAFRQTDMLTHEPVKGDSNTDTCLCPVYLVDTQ